MAKPFKYRGKWRATIKLPNGSRPTQDFEKYQDALQWLADQRAICTEVSSPELDGPTTATLADALLLYAESYTASKGGARAELNRINQYLVATGKLPLRVVEEPTSKSKLLEAYVPKVPKGLTTHLDTRKAKRRKVDEKIEILARTRCSMLKRLDFKQLMTEMQNCGLSESTIQKEIALIRHMFNMAKTDWGWKTFDNPAEGLKLGKSQIRFVALTPNERLALSKALSECDNPYFWPLCEFAVHTLLRKSSLLALTWADIDVEHRAMKAHTKTGIRNIPLSKPALAVLKALPRGLAEQKVFPMSDNAVQMAWEGVREKICRPNLQFRDLRHVGATGYAKKGLHSRALQQVLGHKTIHMAEHYVNLAANDVLELLDALDGDTVAIPHIPVLPSDALQEMKVRRTSRLPKAGRPKKDKTDNGQTKDIPAVGATVVSLTLWKAKDRHLD